MDKYDSLKKYLATGEVPTEDAAAVIITATAEDPCVELLALLCATEMLAKDFHYRAKGKPFYGEHLFADLLWRIGDESDKVNEVYYMGELQQDPPFRSEIAKRAIDIIDAIPEYTTEDGYIKALYEVSNRTVTAVEKTKEAKKVLSGTAAVLDGISEQALQAVALLKRVLVGEAPTVTDSDTPVIAPAE